MSSELRREAVVFGRYLVRTEPSETLVARYCEANRELLAREAPSPADARVLDFARRHAWSVGPLDASAALFAPASLLRKKLLVMTAILETTPEHAERFEPSPVALPGLAWRLAVAGARAAVQVVAGTALGAVLRVRS